MLQSCSHFRVIPKISQATGFRDPECGCSLSPFSFLEAGLGKSRQKAVSSPVPCGAMTAIGVSTLPQVR